MLHFVVEEVSHLGVVLEVTRLVLLDWHVFNSDWRQLVHHLSDRLSEIYHALSHIIISGAVGFAASGAGRIEGIDSGGYDSADVLSRQHDAGVLRGGLVHQELPTVGHVESEEVLGDFAGLGGIRETGVTKGVEGIHGNLGLLFGGRVEDGDLVGILPVGVHGVLNGGDDRVERGGRHSQIILCVELAKLVEDGGVSECSKDGGGVEEEAGFKYAAQLVAAESEVLEVSGVLEIVGIGSAGIECEEAGGQEQACGDKEQEGQKRVDVPEEIHEELAAVIQTVVGAAEGGHPQQAAGNDEGKEHVKCDLDVVIDLVGLNNQ